MDGARLQGKANRSPREKNGKKANVEKVHKNPSAQLFFAALSVMVLVNLEEL